MKFENLQFTASFKERGALNKLLQLSDVERTAGVLAVSAGNHAQGVAYHAQRLGVPATIVMPRFASPVKVERTRKFGAEIVFHGDTFDDARAFGLQLAQERGLTLIHPYDDLDVAAGQGTVGLEMLEQQPEIDTLIVAVGGGGLISGVATAARALKPGIEIIGVQAQRFPAVWQAMHGQADAQAAAQLIPGVKPPTCITVADGIGIKRPGALTLPLILQRVDDMLLASEGDIEQAVLMLLEVEKTVVEGAGAVGLAALLNHRERFAGRKVGLLLCGGNIEPLLLAEIIQRGMARSGRLARLQVDVHDVPGALAEVARSIAPLIGRHTVVLTAMNGVPWWFFNGFGGERAGTRLQSVDPGGEIDRAIPARHVIGGVVHASCSVDSPGVIRHHFGNGLIIGEPSGEASERVAALAALLQRAGLNATVSPQIQKDVWYKLWGNMTVNPVSALTGATTDRILGDDLVRGFISSVMLEAKAIGARIGIPIDQQPEDRHAVTLKLGAFKTSMLQDVQARKSVELDALVTVVRELGQLTGVPTPFTDALLGLSRLQAQTLGLYPDAPARQG